jgi:signal peptidase
MVLTRSGAWGGSERLSPRRVFHGLVVSLSVVFVMVAVLARLVPLTGRTALVVAGPSMTPALPVGSLIVVEPVRPADIAVGDVVSIQSGPNRAVFTHRVIRLVDRDGAVWVETRGDANPAADPSILPAGDVIGRVAVAVPYLGYLVALASQPSGVVLIIAVGLLLMTLSSIPRVNRDAPLPA